MRVENEFRTCRRRQTKIFSSTLNSKWRENFLCKIIKRSEISAFHVALLESFVTNLIGCAIEFRNIIKCQENNAQADRNWVNSWPIMGKTPNAHYMHIVQWFVYSLGKCFSLMIFVPFQISPAVCGSLKIFHINDSHNVHNSIFHTQSEHEKSKKKISSSLSVAHIGSCTKGYRVIDVKKN